MFELGKIFQSRSIYEECQKNKAFLAEVTAALKRYTLRDWGNLCADDKKMNDRALANGDDRILAAYKTSKGKIYIITEWDRSATNIIFASEY